MADTTTTTTFRIEFGATLKLSEIECRALDAMVGYGADAFLKVFKEQLGESYIRNHEAGVRSLFKTIGRDVLPALHDIDRARKDLAEAFAKRAEGRK